jgi:hypothetical protein
MARARRTTQVSLLAVAAQKASSLACVHNKLVACQIDLNLDPGSKISIDHVIQKVFIQRASLSLCGIAQVGERSRCLAREFSAARLAVVVPMILRSKRNQRRLSIDSLRFGLKKTEERITAIYALFKSLTGLNA